MYSRYVWCKCCRYIFQYGYVLLTYACLHHMLWWYGLTYVVDKLRATFELERISLINMIIGVIVMTVSALGLLSTLLGLTLY